MKQSFMNRLSQNFLTTRTKASSFNTLLIPNHLNKKASVTIRRFSSQQKGSQDEAPSELTPYDGVLFKDHTKAVSEIILNKPAKLNSIDLKMVRSILRRVRGWVPYNIDGFSSDEQEGDKPKPKVIIFSGNGKHFCAGGDIVTLYDAKIKNVNVNLLKDFFRYEYLLDYSLTKMTPLQVALWNGAVMGGGAGLSVHAPFRIATERTFFAMPETKIGLFCDVGGSFFLPRILNNEPELGLFLGLTGERIQGRDLAVTGVATHYVNPDIFGKMRELIVQNVSEDSTAENVKDLIDRHSEYVYDQKTFDLANADLIREVFKLDSLEGIYSRLEHFRGNGTDRQKKWAEDILNKLNSYSPISLAVVLEQIKRGKDLSNLEEALNMEAQIVAGFMEDSDFFEGVRALLVEKDGKPSWKFRTYKDLNYEVLIKQYFERNEEIDIDPNN